MVLLSVIAWILLAPFIIEVDTRIPEAQVRWRSIGHARIWFEDEWWFSFQVFFYRKTIRLSGIKAKPQKAKPPVKKKKTKKLKLTRVLIKAIRVIKTFRLREWQLYFDSGNYLLNAQIYPLNYLPFAYRHVYINFMDENYLVLKATNQPWKIVYNILR